MTTSNLQVTLKKLTDKKDQLQKLRPLSADYLKNLSEWFKVELTYNSNAIEGNTLNRRETALVIEKGVTVKGKTLTEHLEATNHAEAIDYVKDLAANTKQQDLTKQDVMNIHKLILQKIDDENAGKYRNVPVAIAGSDVELPDPLKVPELMEEFFTWLKNKSDIHPVIVAADAHYKLVRIHPFVDGNGRTARLLMNLLLMQANYPITVIGNDKREDYINALEKAHMTGDLSNFYSLVINAVDSSLDVYLGNKKPRGVKEERLLKIGELARVSDTPTSTIRFWTNEGLLKVAKTTEGGYRWFNESSLKTVEKIKELQAKRLTLDEIKTEINKANLTS
jgi:Fic family protein